MTSQVGILLCAGYGTRMGEMVASTPKPLLPVAGRGVLDYLLDQLEDLRPALDAVHVVANSRYREAFERWANALARPFPVTVHDDGSTSNDDRLGAAGDLGFVLGRIPMPDAALVAAGDNVLRFSLKPLWEAMHAGTGHRVLALAETRVERLRKTGVLVLGDDGRVLRLDEKPDAPASTWMCPPFYALRRSALERLPAYLEASPNRDEIGRFIADLAGREPVYAVRTEGERLDIGSPESYRRACEVLARDAGKAVL